MEISEAVKKTKELDKKFKTRFDRRDRALDLMEEAGELAQAMQIESGRKLTNDPAKNRTKADVADAICDMLYDLILLSVSYGLDLEKEYKKMLVGLGKRVKKGEFE